MKYEQGKQPDGEFLQWLSPSCWLVESQLSSFRQQRSEGTLQWARDMPEFQAWRLSNLEAESERRITWINGTLGIGKSIMAGYFIDLLKCQYPNAIVSYFFCRSGQPGLTNARDILRTLAYQCIEKDNAARAVLEKLKSKGFQITDTLGIGYLFEKLLLDPLRDTPEIYIILDGLDEADMITRDHTDRTGRPEMHVLLTSLARLPSTRLLCISRPIAKISDVLKNTFSKSVGKDDNAKDIESYVQKTVNESETLKAQFKAAFKDPIQYFREKGNGIFLWVVLVLQQLGKAKSSSVFLKYLDGFSAASGSMEDLYCAILSRIDDEDRKWVGEIIRWLVVTEQQLSVSWLKHLVEWCLQDKLLIDFRRFLDADCGSILQLLPGKKGDENVRLVHDTFRSFVVNREACPSEYFIDVTETHGYLALKCLQYLSKGGRVKECSTYAAMFWVNHLSKATSTQQSKELLVAVYQLFSSEGLRIWVKQLCSSGLQEGLRISVESAPLRDISQWLREICNSAKTSTEVRERSIEIEAVIAWRCAVLGNISILQEAVGRAAASIWLHERLDECSTLLGCFLLGLKYYWKRVNRSQSNLQELQELIASKFIEISVWVADGGRVLPIVERNIGLAFFAVYRWDECIRCFNSDGYKSDEHFEFQKYLGLAFMAKRDYDKAIAVFEKNIEDGWLLTACQAKQEYDIAVKIFQEYLNRHPSSWEHWNWLYDVYRAKGDYDTMITLSESALANNQFEQNRHSLLYYLYTASKQKGEYVTALATFQSAIRKHPKDWVTWSWLGDVYYAIGDYEEAIKILQSGLLEAPHSFLYGDLARVHIAQHNYDGAIEALKTASETQAEVDARLVRDSVEAYEKKGDHDGLIQWFQTIIDKYPAVLWLRMNVFEAHMKAKDYDEAIDLFKTAIECSAFSKQDIQRLCGKLVTAYKERGDHAKAIKIFETKLDLEWASSAWPLGEIFELYEAREDYDAAIKAFETIVNSPNQKGVWGWPTLLKFYVAKGDFDGAMTRFETAVDEGQIELSRELAYDILDIYTANGSYDRAVNKFEDVVHSLPLDAWAWHVLGEACKAKGDYDKAVKVCQSALQHMSSDYSFYKSLCDLYLATSDYQRVVDCYEHARELAPEAFLWAYLSFLGHPRRISVDTTIRQKFLWYSVGEAYKRVGDNAKAYDVYDSVTAQYKLALEKEFNDLSSVHNGFRHGQIDIFWKSELPKVVLWTALGEAYGAKGDIKNSLEAFQQAYVMEPGNAWLQNLIHELETKSSTPSDEHPYDVAATVNQEWSQLPKTDSEPNIPTVE